MIKYTEKQRKQIEQNPNVVKCGVTGITFKKEFKVDAVKEYFKGKSSKQIFRDAGFDEKLLGKNVAKNSLKDWKKIFNRKGNTGLLSKKRSPGRPRKIERTEKEKIKYLEAQVEYLKAENDFLAKLRAKKRAE